MKYLSVKYLFSAMLTVLFAVGVLTVCSLQAQDEEPLDLPPIDETQSDDTPALVPDGRKQTTPLPDLGPEPDFGSETDVSYSGGSDAPVQNAIIEGVQVSPEPGDKPDEKVVSCYFIFRDKPSSYYYEVKMKEKKIIFEFNDTRASAAPVPSVAEPPITGFTIEQRKVDVNKDVRGLKPEWHTQIRIVFKVDQIPEIHVNDEYNIISFSYKWTTDPKKIDRYIVKDNTKKIIFWSTGGVGVVGVAAFLAYILRPGPEPLDEISIEDLPKRPDK
jgi:hypothetical protein